MKRDCSINIKITKDFNDILDKKSEDYHLDKATLSALLTYTGLHVFLNMEKSIEGITLSSGEKELSKVIKKLSVGEDINGLRWAWAVRSCLIPAIDMMKSDDFLLLGLKNIKTAKDLKEDFFNDLSKLKVEGMI
jgi:hypothetical protein